MDAMKHISHLTRCTAVVLALLFSSCVKEVTVDVPADGQPVRITFAADTRAADIPAEQQDNADITSLRVLGYKTTSGALAFNEHITVTNNASSHTVEVLQGEYHFVFVANESLDTDLAAKLAAGPGSFTALKTLTIGSGAFTDNADRVPLVSVRENITVRSSSDVSSGGTSVLDGGVWKVALQRAAVKMRLEVHVEKGEPFANTEIRLNRVPSWSYLYPGIDNQASGNARTITVPLTKTGETADGKYDIYQPMTGGATGTEDRLIFPELLFADKGNKDKGIELEITTDKTRRGVIGVDIPNDYTIPRNKFIDITATVATMPDIEFTVTVTDWGDNIGVPLRNKPERWARSNIVWDGSKLTFAVTQRDNQTIPASSQGVLFKWGSLVGISPSTEAYSPSLILFSANGTKSYDWESIPYVDVTGGNFGYPYPPSRDCFYNFNDGNNNAGPGYSSTGNKGDICRYISANGWVEGNWRLPTQSEYNALIAEIGGDEGSVSNGKYPETDPSMYTPYGSNSYGRYFDGFWQPEPGRWLGEGATRDAARGAAAELVPGGSSVYFPAGGFRSENENTSVKGVLTRVGFSSHFWSGSSASGDLGADAYIINVNKDQAIGSTASRHNYALSVRCIRDEAPAQVFSTDYDSGETISTDGERYIITVASNVEWEATVKSGTDAATEGDVIGEPLLDPTTGFGGGASSGAVVRSGNNRLELVTVDYISLNKFASGELTIVFRNKATGAELGQVSVNVTGNLWARSNIVWDGSKLTFAVTVADNQTIPANVQGVFFKWGSLVAVSPVGAYSSSQILFTPDNAIYTWDNIPYADGTAGKFGSYGMDEDDFEGYDGDTNTSGPGYATTGPNANKGDICRYITDQGWVSGKWRMPTYAEYDALINEATPVKNGSFISTTVPSGGNNANGFWQPASGYWLGMGAADVSTRGDAQVPGISSVYLSAGGARSSSGGNAGSANFEGLYSSASSSTTSSAHTLRINNSGMDSVNTTSRNGVSIRCIRDIK